MFKAPFSFDGRIRRAEYGITVLALNLAWFVLSLLFGATESLALFIIGAIPFVWLGLAQGCKRCHDRGNPGFFMIIPFYGLWMLFGDGQPGSNAYGPNPKSE